MKAERPIRGGARSWRHVGRLALAVALVAVFFVPGAGLGQPAVASAAAPHFGLVGRSSAPTVPPPTYPGGYVASQYNIVDGAQLSPGVSSYDLSSPKMVEFDNATKALLMTAGGNLVEYNGSTANLTKVVHFTGLGANASGRGQPGGPVEIAIDSKDHRIFVTGHLSEHYPSAPSSRA